MQIIKANELSHTVPNNDYPYSSSAKVFQTEQLFLYSERVEPGKRSSAPHFHQSIDEIIYITKGELHAFEGTHGAVLKTGDFICFKANSNEYHYLENKSDAVAEFLLFRKSQNDSDVIYEDK